MTPYVNGLISRCASLFIPQDVDLFLSVPYLLNRKTAINVKARKRPFDELLVLNLGEELMKISEGGIMKEITLKIRALGSQADREGTDNRILKK